MPCWFNTPDFTPESASDVLVTMMVVSEVSSPLNIEIHNVTYSYSLWGFAISPAVEAGRSVAGPHALARLKAILRLLQVLLMALLQDLCASAAHLNTNGCQKKWIQPISWKWCPCIRLASPSQAWYKQSKWSYPHLHSQYILCWNCWEDQAHVGAVSGSGE